MRYIKNLWQRLVCEYEMQLEITPPTYPKKMSEVIGNRIGVESDFIIAVWDYMEEKEAKNER